MNRELHLQPNPVLELQISQNSMLSRGCCHYLSKFKHYYGYLQLREGKGGRQTALLQPPSRKLLINKELLQRAQPEHFLAAPLCPPAKCLAIFKYNILYMPADVDLLSSYKKNIYCPSEQECFNILPKKL